MPANHTFEGAIDELRIWYSERSQTEIQANMFTALTGTETDLELYYDFEDGVAEANNSAVNTLTDLPGNHDASLNNFLLTGTESNFVQGVCITNAVSTNHSLDFDGTDDYIDLDAIPSSTNYSVEFWYNPTVARHNDRILSAIDATTSIYNVWINATKFCVSTGPNGALVDASTTDLVADTWYHIAFVRESPTQVGFYLNGVKEVNSITVVPELAFVDKQTLGQPFDSVVQDLVIIPTAKLMNLEFGTDQFHNNKFWTICIQN